MLKYIKVKPLAAESFGVRSMATLIETPDLKIILDPGASLGVRREYSPHPEEYKVLRRSIRRIINAARNAGYIFISHYHLSHYLPFFRDYRHIWSNRKYATELYSGKFVYMKSTTENITDSERRRGVFLKKRIEQMNGTVVYGDYSEHIIGNTLLKISPPVPHGRISMRRGYVLMISIMYEAEKFLFAPDVLGPYDPYTLEIILRDNPDVLYICGPPLHLKKSFGPISVKKATDNLKRLIEKIDTIILDHYIFRSSHGVVLFQDLKKLAEEKGHKIYTAATFSRRHNNFLESIRQKLWEVYPPKEDFRDWLELGDEIKRITPPSI
ncbi:MAG: hypothetical protein J7L47_03390 [Candidatus Odinarchaeota archaeon]|nr:hypothetical protein [Candidatus Odinarchaeota archaeon]